MHYHFIGIEGIGLSGLANILLENKNLEISGCDLNKDKQCCLLENKGVKIYKGHDKFHLENVDKVIVSSAIPNSNLEIKEAFQRGIPVQTYPEALKEELKNYKYLITVAGTHGKSTTSGMIAYLLYKAGVNPTFLVGANLSQFGVNSYKGGNDYFVLEACEYKEAFLNYTPYYCLITNIEEDHLDYYKNFKNILKAFKKFINSINPNGALIIEEKSWNKLKLKKEELKCKVYLYSLSKKGKSDIKIYNIKKENFGYSFKVNYRKKSLGIFKTSIPGIHNISNALGTIILGLILNIDIEKIKESIYEYKGVERRFQVLKDDLLTIIDDYAHHPTEIRAVLKAVKENYKSSRIYCIFQPHQASRTFFMLEKFAYSFKLANKVIVTDIFYARDSEYFKNIVSSLDLVKRINKRGIPALYIQNFEKNLFEILQYFKNNIRKGDIIITLGAGNINKLAYFLKQNL